MDKVKRFRIVKNADDVTKSVMYNIHHRKRFLFWTWWEKLTAYTDVFLEDTHVMAFDTLEDAKSHLERMSQGFIVEFEEEQ